MNKTIFMMWMLTMLAFLTINFSIAAEPIILNSNQINQEPSSARSQSKTFDLSRLRSPTTPQDLLRLARSISENFLLLDSDFQTKDFLMYLFDANAIYDPFESNQELKILNNRKILIKENSLFWTYFKIKSISAGFAKLPDNSTNKFSSRLEITTDSIDNPFSAELVFHELGPNEEWRDPLNKFNVIGSFENMEYYLRRAPNTHPKGYFQTEYVHQNQIYISTLRVELNENGTLRRLHIRQKDKKS